ncbi:hypothetical protein MUY27_08790 [Mucilaginibacter sp. RS28]|uniref:Subunit length determinant protein n=1 Tax=Mucilaginibacter straminoryzae TaxID=2932774 RepID=A0A9X1X578_9SPHI|nr:hypothetical protein [Mucilaginibacter straminoryzae]MCJ8209803.1 hypothetical protein [Mucilaginibacter straminoryzae]
MSNANTPYPYEPEFSFKKLWNDRVDDIRYVLRFWKTLLLLAVIGGLLGALAAYFKRPTYTARLTFVIDDSKSGGMSGLASLAGQFGFSLDGIGGGSGVLAGDNVQELLKSRKLIEETLESPYDPKPNFSLADEYAQVHKLQKQWTSLNNNKPVSFPIGGKNYSRLQDSLLHEITQLVLENNFSISKTDKKLGFFEVTTTMKDEKLAQLFCERMIKQATSFYITTKTTRLRNNVARLQNRADSIGAILNRKTYAVSSANRTLLDLNPAYTNANANVEVKERDKIVLSTIFSETVKNLEASKTMLAQETPTVTIVDEPELPLKKNKLKYTVAIPAGIFITGLLFAITVLLLRKKEPTITATQPSVELNQPEVRANSF